jgi:hypothetical protein
MEVSMHKVWRWLIGLVVCTMAGGGLLWAGTAGYHAFLTGAGNLRPMRAGVPLILDPDSGQSIQLTTAGGGQVLYNGKPMASAFAVNVKDPPYLAVGDGVANDTAAIQAAIDAAANTTTGLATVFIPAGQYLIDQLRMKRGVSLIGAGIASPPQRSTILLARAGANVSAIVPDSTDCPATEYWHWSVIAHINIRKQTPHTDTVGSGIEVTCRSGEGLKFEHILVNGMPESGIRYKRGGVPIYIEDLHFFGNDRYGLELERTGADNWQLVAIKTVSGDNNQIALIRISQAGSDEEVFYIDGVKAEIGTIDPTAQPNVIELDGLLGAMVLVSNVSAKGIGATGNSIVRIINQAARVSLWGIRKTNFNFLIDDVFGARTVPWDTNTQLTMYHTSASRHVSYGATGIKVGGTQAFPRLFMNADGHIDLGPNNAASDVRLTRNAADRLDILDQVRVTGNAGAGIDFTTDNTVDVGASGANRPRTVYVGTSVATPTLTYGGVLFANLGTPGNGTVTFCTDCSTASNPCTGTGTGALAVRQNGAWKCL